MSHPIGSSSCALRGTPHLAQGVAPTERVLNTLGKLGGLILGVVGLSACSGTAPTDSKDPPLNATLVSEREATRLPFSCPGAITVESDLVLEHSSERVSVYTCWGEESTAGVLHFVNQRGIERTMDEMRVSDHVTFRDRHQRVDADLRGRLAEKLSAMLRVDVWFTTPDEALPLAKEEVLALSTEARGAMFARRTVALRTRANEIMGRIDALPGDVRYIRVLGGELQATPVVTLEASPEQIRAIGQLDGVVAIGNGQTEEIPANEAWYDVDQIPHLVTSPLAYDGDGVIVGEVYGGNGIQDTTYNAFAPGSCNPPFGPSYRCYCPAAAATGTGGNHMSQTMGMIKNTHPSLRGGVAKNATIIIANDTTGDHCAWASFAGGVDWALAEGANVLNRSGSTGVSASRYLDFRARSFPYPTVVVAAGNEKDDPILNDVLNGLTVGAGQHNESPDPADMQLASFSSHLNPSLGASGREAPHLVAPGVSVLTTSGVTSPATQNVSGTSFATPQVTGVAAALMEAEPDLKFWPEAVFAILLAGPTENIHGVWPLELSDANDDRDGVGALDAKASELIARTKVDGGQTAVQAAFDFGTITPGDTSSGIYAEQWSAQVPAGETLRVASVMFADVSCTMGNPASCSGRDFVRFRLRAVNSSGTTVKEAFNINSNYEYFAWQNTSASTVNVSLRIKIEDWDGLSNATFATAWSSVPN